MLILDADWWLILEADVRSAIGYNWKDCGAVRPQSPYIV